MAKDPIYAESVEDALARPSKVRSLHLSVDERGESSVLTIDPRIVGLSALEAIHLGSNRSDISRIDGIEALASIPTLRELDIFLVGPLKLPAAIFALTQLERLSLRGRWKKLPAALGKLTNLWKLELALEDLDALPDAIGKLISLEHLSLRGSRVAHLPDSIGNLSALVDFFAEGIGLVALPDSIDGLQSLRRLLVSRNAIRKVPASLATIPTLVRLDLADNPKLAMIPDELARRAGLAIEIEHEKLPIAQRDETLDEAARALARLSAAAAKAERTAWTFELEPGEASASASKLGGVPYVTAETPTPRCGICDEPMALFFQVDLAPTGESAGLLQVFGCGGEPTSERLAVIAKKNVKSVEPTYREHLAAFFKTVPEVEREGIIERARAWKNTAADARHLKKVGFSGNTLEYTLRYGCRVLGAGAVPAYLLARIVDVPAKPPRDSKVASPPENGPKPMRIVRLAKRVDRPTVSDLGLDDAWELEDALTDDAREEVRGWNIREDKIGGCPPWLDDAVWPKCPSCRKKTTRLVAAFGGNSEGTFGKQLEGTLVYVTACANHPRALVWQSQGG